MQLAVGAVDAVGQVAATRHVGEVEVTGPAWDGKGVGLGGGEGERVGWGEAGGPALTPSEGVIETVAVRVLVRTVVPVPVIAVAIFIAAVAGAILPARADVLVEGEVIEDCERVIGAGGVWFEGFGRGDGVDMRRFVDQGSDSAAARGEVGDVGARASEAWYSLEDIGDEDHEAQVMGGQFGLWGLNGVVEKNEEWD